MITIGAKKGEIRRIRVKMVLVDDTERMTRSEEGGCIPVVGLVVLNPYFADGKMEMKIMTVDGEIRTGGGRWVMFVFVNSRRLCHCTL